MAGERWIEVCSPEVAVQIDVSDFCSPIDRSVVSPIDAAYEYFRSAVVLGPPALVAESPALGRLLLLGLVSAVDDYFRRVLAGLIAVCPLARIESVQRVCRSARWTTTSQIRQRSCCSRTSASRRSKRSRIRRRQSLVPILASPVPYSLLCRSTRCSATCGMRLPMQAEC